MARNVDSQLQRSLLRRYRIAIALVVLVTGIALTTWSTGRSGLTSQAAGNIGIFLSTVVAVSFLYEYLLRPDDRHLFLGELDQLLSDRLGGSGLRAYRNRRAISGLADKFEAATQEVLILQTNLTTVLEFMDCLREAQRRAPSLKIRVLTLDPDSEYLVARGRSLWSEDSGNHFVGESRGSLAGFIQRAHQMGLRVDLRTYDEPPAFVMFKIDAEIILAFITAGGVGRDHLHLQFSDAMPGAHETFTQHFDLVWRRARAHEAGST